MSEERNIAEEESMLPYSGKPWLIFLHDVLQRRLDPKDKIPHSRFLSLAMVGVLFIFVMNIWTGVNLHASGMALLGRCSGSIYLWHTPLLMPAVSAGLFACGFISPLTCLLNIGISLAICIGFRLILEKIALRIFRCSLPRVLTL